MAIAKITRCSYCPIRSWCANVEEDANEEIVELAQHPILALHALMPDFHIGKGTLIGIVIPPARRFVYFSSAWGD